MLFLKAEFHQLFWSCLHISADNREPMCQPQPEPHFPTVKNEVFIFRKAIKITWKISEHAQGGSQTRLEFKNTNLHASNFRKEGTVTEKKKNNNNMIQHISYSIQVLQKKTQTSSSEENSVITRLMTSSYKFLLLLRIAMPSQIKF